MPRGLVLIADGVDGTHLEYAYHRLREDAVLVDVATPGGGPVRTAVGASRDATALADLPPARRYDLVVIPGGEAPAALAEWSETRSRLTAQLEANDIVCAIATGVELLLVLEVLPGRLVTGPATLEAERQAGDAEPTGEAVTVDGPLVTVRDTAALPFGIAAALASVAIPQDPASEAAERPVWTRD